MKVGLNVVAVVLLLVGGVWFFQGINILLGSPMSGQPFWAIMGTILVVVGVAVLLWNNRRPVGTR
jgi:ABC-type glucose/galactose transport system permease subunit